MEGQEHKTVIGVKLKIWKLLFVFLILPGEFEVCVYV